MAESVTQTYQDHRSVKLVTMDWTSAAGGTVSSTNTTNSLNGEVYQVEINPDASTDAPTEGYDVTLSNANSVNILYGLGANLPAATTRTVKPCVFVDSKLSLCVTNAGDTKGGVVKIYLR